MSALPAAIYTTDAAGRITFYNAAAAQLWGCQPELFETEFCGSWKLYWPDGRPMRHDECPMAVALRTGKPVRGLEAVAERPDGTRVPFIPYPTPLRDAAGQLIGAINMLVDTSDRKAFEQTARAHTGLFETLNGIAKVSSELDLRRIEQMVTDIAVKVSGAEFGAFVGGAGVGGAGDGRDSGSAILAVSGTSREAFEALGLTRNAGLGATLRPTVTGADDARGHARRMDGGPDRAPLADEVRVASHLAVHIAYHGKGHGMLVLAHAQPGVFTEQTESMVAGIAALAGIAIENASLYASERQLATIVETSTDAIVSKDLNGIVRSWNQGAERLFGFTAAEMVGRSVTNLIPPERQDEEDTILGRIRRGERVEPYDTVRARRDGTLVDISLAVSPVKDAEGRIIGASKIARDITERKQAQARQELLTCEVQHRTKNLFAVVRAVVARSFAGKRTVEEAQASVLDRLHSLAQTHVMLLDEDWSGVDLAEVVRTEARPYPGRIAIDGPQIILDPQAAQNFALAVHELATNAAKYGALSNGTGQVLVAWEVNELNGERRFRFCWMERDGPPVSPPRSKGFGSAVLEQMMADYFDDPPRIEFAPSGIRYELRGALKALTGKA
ncbi:MAG: PAS domain S-box protein [Hyphomicrobiaceae bacterium]|nr:PAS domain S-box protein [Hyphomicrobiaceae bacterium]